MAYRGQFQTWAPGRCLVDIKSKASNPDIFDIHNERGKSYGLYAWNFKASKARHPSISGSEMQNKLYNSALFVNNFLLLKMMFKGDKGG